MRISAQYPWMLLLLPVLYAIILFSVKGLRIRQKGKKQKTVIIRLLLITTIVFAMADFSVSLQSEMTTTVFLLDVSDSFLSNRDKATKMIQDSLKELPSDNQAGIIAFGADTAVEQFVTGANLFDGIETSPVSTATDIEQAVQAGMGLFPAGSAKRMVLITDGNENQGEVSNMGMALSSNKISLKVMKLDNEIGEEVYISDVKVPEKINTGDQFAVHVTVESSVETSAVLYLYAGDKLKKKEEVWLQKGSNSFVFQDVRKKEGFVNYRVEIDAREDTYSVNNQYVACTRAEMGEKILLIEGKEGEAEQFVRLLRSANISCDRVLPGSAPRSLEGMTQYKSIILENIYVDDLPDNFIKFVEPYVRDYGGGLVATGGDSSFALGGYRDTSLETVLPVKMELTGEKEIPKMAMIMVIDHSGSMSVSENGAYNKLNLAKEAAVAAIDNLRDTDMAGVLGFDDQYQWVSKLSQLTDKEDVQRKIGQIKEGGGTSIYPALEEAYKKIKKSDAELKHIVLLTDGQDTFNNYSELVTKINNDDVTLSTVAVGSDADSKLLEHLSDSGGGRFYQTDAGTDLPRIFAQEVYLSGKEYLVNRKFTPAIGSRSEILDGLSEDGLPAMKGYVATTKKDTASDVLLSDEEDPILSYWQYGLGKTVAFTSDVTNEWTSEYAAWEDYPTLWRNIVDWTIQEKQDGEATVTVSQEGSLGKVTYQTQNYTEKSQVEVVYSDENGNTEKKSLEAISPGIFETQIPITETGVYNLNVRKTEDGQVMDSQNSILTMQYSSEYRLLEGDSTLEDMVSQAGGDYLTSLKGLYQEKLGQVATSRNITTVFLILAAFLLFYDIAWRRLGISLLALVRKKIPVKKEENLKKKPQEKKKSKPVYSQKEEGKSSVVPPIKEKQKPKKKQEKQKPLDMDMLLNKKEERNSRY